MSEEAISAMVRPVAGGAALDLRRGAGNRTFAIVHMEILESADPELVGRVGRFGSLIDAGGWDRKFHGLGPDGADAECPSIADLKWIVQARHTYRAQITPGPVAADPTIESVAFHSEGARAPSAR